MKRFERMIIATLALISFITYSCGKNNDPNPKPKPVETGIDGYWKGTLFTSYSDSAVMIFRSGVLRIWIAYQRSIDTTTTPQWSGSYNFKGDSVTYVMQPDTLFHDTQKGKGLFSPSYDQSPATLQINYYYDDPGANGTGTYFMDKQSN